MHKNLRRRGNRSVVALVIFSMLVAIIIGYTVLRSKTAHHRATANSEAQTLLELTNSFVSVYSQHTQYSKQTNSPVPAAFRAQAARQFNKIGDRGDRPVALMVGIAGREIATPPVDDALARRLELMRVSGKNERYSIELNSNDDHILRTVFPTIANQDSCVACHNRLQPDGPAWTKGDLMGAYVVDRSIGQARQSILRFSMLVGVLSGVVSLLGGILFGYSKRLRTQAIKLRILANTDPLTGCLNRRALNDAFESDDIRKSNGALLVLDLDHFKNINDTYGHDTGDRVLIHFTQLVRSQLRDSDVLARIGGEEFVILLPNSNSAEAHIIAQRTRNAVNSATMQYAETEIHYTVSIGAVEFLKSDNPNLGLLLSVADKFLYRAKKRGRNQVFPVAF